MKGNRPVGDRRILLFVVVVAVSVLTAGGAIAWSLIRDGSDFAPASSGPMTGAGAPGVIAQVAQPDGAVLFQNVLPGDHWNQVGLVPGDTPDSPRTMVPWRCLRIHFAAGRGLCLAEGDGPPGTFAAYILDSDLQELGEVELGGLPSRTRVSPDGRYGATTTFVTGHSYAEDGFSTETLLLEIDSAKEIANLEEFTAIRDGEEFSNEDFNYWGVTFTKDSNRFYATLGTGGRTYLVQGDIAAQQVEVLRENVECPSISPDNTRIAFKKKVGGDIAGTTWRFHVLDLETMTETPLAETRSIDDQIMWLDNDHILYGDGSDTWVVPADGSGEPRRYMSKAVSAVFIDGADIPAGEENSVARSTAAPDQGDVLTLAETDLGVQIDMPPTAPVSSPLTYTITVTNNGPNEATWLVVDHYLPENSTFSSASSTDPPGIAYGCSAYPDEDRIRCDTASLAPGGSWTIEVIVQPDLSGTGTFRATVGGTENDPVPANDQAEAEVDFGAQG